MTNKMKYAVVMSSNYTAKLYTGKLGTDGGLVDTISLDSKLPMNHGKQRELVDQMMSKNNITAMSFNFTTVDKKTSILHGDYIDFKSEEMQDIRKENKRVRKITRKLSNSEAGFSLIELAVACAILAIISTMSLPYYAEYQKNMEAQAQILQGYEDDRQAQLNGLAWGN